MSDSESDVNEASGSSEEEDTVSSNSETIETMPTTKLPIKRPHSDSTNSESSDEEKEVIKKKRKTNNNKSRIMTHNSTGTDNVNNSNMKNIEQHQIKNTQMKVQSKGRTIEKNKQQVDSESEESISETSESQEGSDESSDESEENTSSEPSDKDDLDEEEQVDQEYAVLRKELSDLPFEDLQKLKERIGTKVFAQIMRDGKARKPAAERPKLNQPHKTKPLELSSKKKVSVLRQSNPVKKTVFRDPRFDDLSGQYSDEYFKKNYSFLGDVKERDKQKLIKQLRREEDPDKKQQIASLVQRMNQQERSEKQKESRTQLEKNLKIREKELVQTGKTPFFLKKSEKRKLELAEKYKELKATGNVDTYLSKKRKKNAAKEKKKLPFRE